MATKSAIGKLATEAMADLDRAMRDIGTALGIDPLDLAAVRYRDPAYQDAMRLRVLADWAATVAGALQPTREPEAEAEKPARRKKSEG